MARSVLRRRMRRQLLLAVWIALIVALTMAVGPGLAGDPSAEQLTPTVDWPLDVTTGSDSGMVPDDMTDFEESSATVKSPEAVEPDAPEPLPCEASASASVHWTDTD